MGMLQVDPKRGVGEWQGVNNPVEVSKPLVSLTDSDAGKKVGVTSEGLLSTGASVKGYVDVQDGAAWHKAFNLGTTGTKKSSSGSYTIELDRPLTVAEMQALNKVAGQRGLDVIDTGEGVTLANFNPTRGENLAETIGSGKSPLKRNLNKVFSKRQAGAVKEIKFKLKKDPSKEGKKYLTDLRQGNIDGNKYKVRVKDRYVTITQIKSQGDEMERLLDKPMGWSRGLDADIEKIFPGHEGTLARVEGDLTEFDWSQPGSGNATRKIQEVLNDNPAVLAKLDNSPKFRQKVKEIADRNEAWAKKQNDTVRDDIQNALRLIENGGFTALFDALKRGAILPAIAGPMLMYGLRQESGQTEGLLSPET
jgi:mRNA-degrading endonuclease RelE of RelBE toxin-antitoxin system